MSEEIRPILVAEDEESDRMILELAVERAKLRCPVMLVRDGQEAVEYLIGAGRFADRIHYPLPALIVLDLKMPRMNGFDVLAWLAKQPEFKAIPAVMLSSSAAELDISKARELGAREYFVKPHVLADLIKIVQLMQTQWLLA